MRGKWQDDFWTVLLAAPFILCFTPGLQDVAEQGFVILSSSVPPWYQTGMGAALAWAFGKDRAAEIAGRIMGRKRD
ncbi:hypothetical protein [Paracoccus sp. TOH]|uniref:hypothetical protein n=1 Tax=Paracoccus sp. TOH TaxID=1263728 RepID=UPI0025B1633B|nr:hypothetical protein [Paracoccus sp. TOH]WJS83890.1 hypothetical protein NBE95_08955 [Paracoccus sp. TOH]